MTITSQPDQEINRQSTGTDQTPTTIDTRDSIATPDRHQTIPDSSLDTPFMRSMNDDVQTTETNESRQERRERYERGRGDRQHDRAEDVLADLEEISDKLCDDLEQLKEYRQQYRGRNRRDIPREARVMDSRFKNLTRRYEQLTEEYEALTGHDIGLQANMRMSEEQAREALNNAHDEARQHLDTARTRAENPLAHIKSDMVMQHLEQNPQDIPYFERAHTEELQVTRLQQLSKGGTINPNNIIPDNGMYHADGTPMTVGEQIQIATDPNASAQYSDAEISRARVITRNYGLEEHRDAQMQLARSEQSQRDIDQEQSNRDWHQDHLDTQMTIWRQEMAEAAERNLETYESMVQSGNTNNSFVHSIKQNEAMRLHMDEILLANNREEQIRREVRSIQDTQNSQRDLARDEHRIDFVRDNRELWSMLGVDMSDAFQQASIKASINDILVDLYEEQQEIHRESTRREREDLQNRIEDLEALRHSEEDLILSQMPDIVQERYHARVAETVRGKLEGYFTQLQRAQTNEDIDFEVTATEITDDIKTLSNTEFAVAYAMITEQAASRPNDEILQLLLQSAEEVKQLWDQSRVAGNQSRGNPWG